MVDVGDDNASVLSESSDLQRARKMYADLQAMSMDSNASQEVFPCKFKRKSSYIMIFSESS